MTVFAVSNPRVEASRYVPVEANRAVQSVTAVGDLNAMRKRQSHHKRIIGNWNIASLVGKEKELFEEANR